MILACYFGPQNFFSPNLVLGILNNVVLSDIFLMLTQFAWWNDDFLILSTNWIITSHTALSRIHWLSLFVSLFLVTGRCFSQYQHYFTNFPWFLVHQNQLSQQIWCPFFSSLREWPGESDGPGCPKARCRAKLLSHLFSPPDSSALEVLAYGGWVSWGDFDDKIIDFGWKKSRKLPEFSRVFCPWFLKSISIYEGKRKDQHQHLCQGKTLSAPKTHLPKPAVRVVTFKRIYWIFLRFPKILWDTSQYVWGSVFFYQWSHVLIKNVLIQKENSYFRFN